MFLCVYWLHRSVNSCSFISVFKQRISKPYCAFKHYDSSLGGFFLNLVSAQTNIFVDLGSFGNICISGCCFFGGETRCSWVYTSFCCAHWPLEGFLLRPSGGKTSALVPPLVELISCFLAVNKEAYCNPLDKYQAEYGNQLKAICMSVLKPAARDFLSCHLS